ncbi:T9SS type A sorting domain-containing protein [Salibacteraceae bacterium]|nr:T9SS type A sorting domain-containing protein [Salibacteraceae bacterium]
MRKILLTALVILSFNVAWSSVSVSSATLTSSPAADCRDLTYSISGTLGAANYTFTSATANVSGSTITVSVVYNQQGIGIQIPTPFSQNINLGKIAAGNYTISFVGYLASRSYRPLNSSVSINSCCKISSAFTANDSAICTNDTIKLTNTSLSSTSQVWLKNGSPVDTSKNYSEILTQPGSYIYSLISISACGNDTTSKTIRILENPELGKDTSLCLYDDITYTIPSGWSKYFWSDSSTASSLKISVNGTYALTVTAPSGCIRRDSVKVSFIGPKLNLGPDKGICPNGTVTLDAGVGLWKSVKWAGGETTDQITVSSPGVYVATVTNSIGCVFNDAISVDLDKDSIFTVMGSDTVCVGDSVTLSLDSKFASYKWFDGDTNQSKLFSSIGVFPVEAVSTAGCTLHDTGYVGHNPLPNLNLGSDTVLCNGSTWEINATTPGVPLGSYRWQNASSARTFIVKKRGTYSVSVIDTNGCTASDTIVVTYKECTADTGNGETSVLHLNNPETETSIYPNPNFGRVFITNLDVNETHVFKLHSVSGQVMIEEEIARREGASEVVLPEKIEEGVYFYTILSNNGIVKNGKLLLTR